MTEEKKYYRRPKRRRFSRKGRDRAKVYSHARSDRHAHYQKPRIDPELRSVFKKIGVPEPGHFKADPFQQEALALIKDCDVIVSAATGSGKTWIATQAIHSYLAQGLSVWYASPLKALSNSIYQQFCHEFGSSNCGILTGDRKENPGAPVIVGTTEILRNQLYDSMHKGTSISADLVILDEAHYLSDPDRGVVWEEVLIYLPSRIRLLLLSATISNAEEICEWLREIRKTPNRVVRSDERPVPLEMLLLFHEGLVVPLTGKKGLNPKVKKFLASRRHGQRRRSERFDFGKIISQLREFNLLPAIFFLKSRSDCDRAVFTCPSGEEVLPKINSSIKETAKAFLKDYPHIRGHRQLKPLMESRVGSHHGGQLPYWKVLVEKMMSKGYLEAIFSTSTVAAGVNFPARTVVLVQSDRYNGREFVDLTATDFHQMIGRAGRRGKDLIGFGVVIPGIHQDPQLINDLINAPAEPIVSQIHINFSMTLNLLLSHNPLEVKELLGLSFASFQEKKMGPLLKRRWDALLLELKKILPKGRCDTADPYEVIENIQKRLELNKEMKHLARDAHYKCLIHTYKAYLKPGRLFLHKNGNAYVASHTYMDRGRFICAAYSTKNTPRTRKRRFKLKNVDMNQVKAIYDHCIDLSEGYSPDDLDPLFNSMKQHGLKTLRMNMHQKDTGNEELDRIQVRLGSLPCEACEHAKRCHGKRETPLKKLLRDFQSLGEQMKGRGGGLWLGFRRHMRFLKETGFVDDNNQLTPDGLWASKLRLDQPLVIAEAIRTGALNGVSPEIMAGGLAPFVWDRTLEVAPKVDGVFNLTELEKRFSLILDHIERIRALKNKRGFDTPAILFWPAAALFMWAKGVPWEHLLTFVPVDEGDMASLIMRTTDHLRQVAALEETHPQLTAVAQEAIKLILREPVYIDFV